VKLSDPFFLQDLKSLLAWRDGQSISDEALEGHQSSAYYSDRLPGSTSADAA
jgi:hypothetical protein